MIERPIRSREVQQILEIEDPALANLWITQAYHDLATGLTTLYGTTDATWCAFAIWASKTAGRSIRADYMARVNEIFADSSRFARALGWAGSRLNPGRWLSHRKDVDRGGLFAGLGEIAQRTSSAIAKGNRRVFEELGPIFAHMIETFEDRVDAGPDVFETFLKTHVDPRDPSGALRIAMTDYLEAITLDDPVQKSQRILLANCRAVLHEQRELQESIAFAMDAPVDYVLGFLPDHTQAWNLPKWLDYLLGFARRWVVRETRDLWEQLMTETVMTIRTADEILALGRDVPPLPTGQAFPEGLMHPQADLEAFLSEWDRTGGTGVGSGADDWEQLGDRMNYITNLFRSRQQHPALFHAPYTARELDDMASGRVPDHVE